MSLYQKKSESCESNDLISKCSGEDLVTKRQSILDELRQKVNVLSVIQFIQVFFLPSESLLLSKTDIGF
jgi:hypothetical protein